MSDYIWTYSGNWKRNGRKPKRYWINGDGSSMSNGPTKHWACAVRPRFINGPHAGMSKALRISFTEGCNNERSIKWAISAGRDSQYSSQLHWVDGRWVWNPAERTNGTFGSGAFCSDSWRAALRFLCERLSPTTQRELKCNEPMRQIWVFDARSGSRGREEKCEPKTKKCYLCLEP